MKYFLKISLFAMAVMFMQGCATHQNFVNKYNAWVGQDINDLPIFKNMQSGEQVSTGN